MNKMEISFKTTLNSSILYVSPPEDLTPDEFSINMLKNAKIAGLMPFDTETMDGRFGFSFDLSLMQPLDKVFSVSSISHTELKLFIKSLSELSADLEDHLLDIRDVLFRTDTIFMDMDKSGYYFCICPGTGGAGSDDFRLLCNQLLSLIDYSDREAVALAFVLNRFSHAENFSFSHLETLISEKDDDPFVPFAESSKNEYFPSAQNAEPARKGNSSGLSFADRARIYFHGKGISEIFNDINSGKIIRKIKNAEKPVDLYDAVIRSAPADAEPILLNEAADTYITQPGSRDPGCAADYRSEMSEASNAPSPSAENIRSHEAEIKSSASGGENAFSDISIENTADLGRLFADRHTLTGKGCAEGVFARIDRYPYTIGKLENSVDLRLDFSYISRLHGRIFNESDGISYEDLNSTNGSFINGTKVPAFTRTALAPGDTLTLADLDFSFR